MIHLKDLFLRSAVTGENPEFLVGRQDLIRDLTSRLAEDRISGVVYGARGVGKTSIAWQVATILAGANRRFNRRDILINGRGPEFIFVFHKCSRFIDTIGDLLVELTLSHSSNYSFQSQLGRFLEDHESYQSISRKIGLGIPKIAEYSEEHKLNSGDPLGDYKKILHF